MKRLFRMSCMKVICANVSDLLFKLSVSGIGLYQINQIDELSVTFCVRQRQSDLAISIIEQSGGEIERCVPASGSILIKDILHRPVLIAGIVLVLFLTVYMPTRILFITVSGNDRIPERQILDMASGCGVYFGAARHEIRSETVKNRLLKLMPDLQWVGVNTRGCVAHISVRERPAVDKEADHPVVSSIIASHDGVIKELTVRKGNSLCFVGQAVRKGQLLVSGYSDCGRCLYGTRADAEIYAQTSRNLRLTMLSAGVKKGQEKRIRRKVGLIIGKKRINFFKGSGISDATCVRMYREYPLTLPGGFELPVSFSVQEEIECSITSIQVETQQLESIMKSSAQDYLRSQMIAGTVEQMNCRITETEGAVHMIGQFFCDEMIGQSRSEEIINNYEQTD